MEQVQKKRKTSIIETIEPAIEEIVSALNLETYDLEWVKEAGNQILRLYIDSEKGVDLNDCEQASRAVEKYLDEHDPIPVSYTLEVSSPGIERRLKKDKHYKRYIGERVKVKLFSPMEGRKKFTGILSQVNEAGIEIVDEDGNNIRIDKKQIGLCSLSVFDD